MANKVLIETYVALRERLHAVALRMLGDEPDADDAVQDAFEHLWTAREAADSDEARFRLFAVLRNVCVSRLRQRGRWSADEVPERGVAPAMPDEAEALKERLMRVLTPLQRRVFELATFEELEYDEIARRLELTQEAVRAHVSRARRKVREAYAKWEND